MSQYVVELIGTARELVTVEASSEEEAMANWQNGESYLVECIGMDPVSVREED